MDFISIKFALLAITSVFILYIINPKYRIAYLAVLSSGFIASFHFNLLLYVLIYTSVNYYIGLRIPGSKNKIGLFRLGIILNLSQLILLKYSSFIIDPSLQALNSSLQVSKLSEIIVPMGISYFTLQGIGYLINIKMKWEEPENKFLDFLLYIIFYPKFLSGPIERSNHFLPQLKSGISFNEQQVSEGLRIALFGFFKKVVIANNLAPFVTEAHSDLASFTGPELWIVLLIQPLYLYLDFSGYTDIAIGISKAYGINILPNFRQPFLAESMTEFWKRFHISLSSWFNDYVFKQVCFKYRRWGKYAAVFAVFLTWTLFGIWHGSGWNFMALGFLQALAINYEFFTKRSRIQIFSKLTDFWRVFLSRIITYVFYGFSLVFFFSPNLNSSLQYFYKLTDLTSWSISNTVHTLFLFALGLSFIVLLLDYLKQYPEGICNRIERTINNSRFLRNAIYYSMIFLIMIFIGKKLIFVYQVF